MASLRDTVAQLKAKAYALPPGGPVPSDQQRKEMLSLTTDVKQPNWPGRGNTIVWIEQGMTPGGPWQPYTEEGQKQRKARYSEAVRLIAQIELGKLLRDPETAQIAVRYLQGMGDYFERAASENIEGMLEFISSSAALESGPDSAVILSPSDYLQVVNDYTIGSMAEKLDRRLKALELPDFVTEFIEDRVRSPLFEGGLSARKSSR